MTVTEKNIQDAVRQLGADDVTCKSFSVLIEFFKLNPDKLSRFKFELSEECIRKIANKFMSGRHSNGPVIPKTIPDLRVRDVLQYAYNVDPSNIDKAIDHHMQAMGAENFIGWILEQYIAEHAEPIGWIWCSGSLVKSIDFIKKEENTWEFLQIKNRSNSENSSSSKVRDGTTIKKWFRIFANNGKTNWEAFPDSILREKLSENDFREYLLKHIKN